MMPKSYEKRRHVDRTGGSDKCLKTPSLWQGWAENVAATKSRTTPIRLRLAARLTGQEPDVFYTAAFHGSLLARRNWNMPEGQQVTEKEGTASTSLRRGGEPEDRCDTHFAEVAFLDPKGHSPTKLAPPPYTHAEQPIRPGAAKARSPE